MSLGESFVNVCMREKALLVCVWVCVCVREREREREREMSRVLVEPGRIIKLSFYDHSSRDFHSQKFTTTHLME